MKKTVSILLILVILLSLFSVANAENIYTENFEKTKAQLLASGWVYSSVKSEPNVSVEFFNGSNCLKISDPDNKTAYGLKYVKTGVKTGETYIAGCNVYLLSGSLFFYLQYYDKSGVKLYSNSQKITASGKWEYVSLSSSVPEGAVSVGVVLCGNSNTVGEGYYDNIKLKKISVSGMPMQTQPQKSSLVTPVNNNLLYKEYNEKGDKIPDYSYAGYYGGEKELPESDAVKVFETIYPDETSADDTSRINTAINNASAAYAKDGVMRKVKLKAGKYKIGSDSIKVKSGVLLSGEGQGVTGTLIYAYDKKQYSVIKAVGSAYTLTGEKAYIADDYVKAGSNTFNILENDVKNFKTGDSIIVYHPATEAWSKAMDMNSVENTKGEITTWNATRLDMAKERTITAINGTEITVDIPIYVPLMKKYTASYIQKFDDSKKIHDFGIENLRIESYYAHSTDEAHSNNGVEIKHAKNGFVRDVSVKYYILSAVRCSDGAKMITIKNCSALKPISIVDGSRRYSFAVANKSQQVLVTGCYSFEGRHDYQTSYYVTGPVVFSDNVAESASNITEPHGVWSTGILFDNIYHIGYNTKGFIGLTNRGIYGSGYSQGWTTAGSVIWNSLAPAMVSHKPTLTYQNFLIGVYGRYDKNLVASRKKTIINTWSGVYRTESQYTGNAGNFATDEDTPFIGDSYKELHYTSAEPASLYKAQLSERLMGDYRFVKPNAPIIYSPSPETEISDNSLVIYGSFKLGAEAVNVYIDDVLYKANIDTENNVFSLIAELPDGYHKIYATQVINGIEGNKNADRFIKVGGVNNTENPSYMQSIYNSSKTEPLNTFEASVFTPEGNENKILYKGKWYDNKYIFISNPVTKLNDAEIEECGVAISLTPEFKKSADYKYSSINNPVIMVSGFENGKTYYLRPYITYKSNADGKENTVFGNVSVVH